MKSITTRGSIRLATALCAMAFALVGSAVASGPAQAADEPQHCVVTLPESGEPKCFATYEEAQAFVAAKAETGPGKEPAAGTASARGLMIWWPVLIYTGFDLTNYNPFGGSLWVVGLNGPCTTPTTNVDYDMSSLGNWNNRISSYLVYSNCWAKHYDLVNFAGGSIGYSGSMGSMGALNNDASSIRWS